MSISYEVVQALLFFTDCVFGWLVGLATAIWLAQVGNGRWPGCGCMDRHVRLSL
jgi:hypothetical protein